MGRSTTLKQPNAAQFLAQQVDDSIVLEQAC